MHHPLQCPDCQFYNALVQSTDDYIFVCDMAEDTFYFPDAMVEDFALPGRVIQNAADVWGGLIHPKERPAFFRSFQALLDGETACHDLEYRVRNRAGEWIWLRCRGHLEHDADGRPTIFAGIISNLGKNNKVDLKTGLFNKISFENNLTELLRHSNVSGYVLILGLDNFKHVNDLYDRQFGDAVIRASAQKILRFLPPDATLFRLDGDEFGLIVENAKQEEIKQLYNRIRAEFLHQQELNQQKYYCTISAGCSSFPQDGKLYADLYKYAEYSLEFSKASGKNRLCFFSHDITALKLRTLELTELLRASIINQFEGFELYFQPQVDAANRTLRGAEALLRWNCSKYGRVPADEFVPLLEKSGLILPVGRWVFSSAVKTCKEWLSICPNFVMSVNLSYLQLKENEFISFMRETLNEAAVEPRHIVVELTESCIASGSQILEQFFKGIREIGLRIAMDDFGTGYSSLSVLKNTPTDVVKIDRTFVRDILISSFDATFIRFIVALCHDAGIETCLEGVETEAEFNAVCPMGLDSIQGYLFGKPQPGAEFYQAWLAPMETPALTT